MFYIFCQIFLTNQKRRQNLQFRLGELTANILKYQKFLLGSTGQKNLGLMQNELFLENIACHLKKIMQVEKLKYIFVDEIFCLSCTS